VLGEGQEPLVEADLARRRVVVEHQGPGVVEQDLLGHAPERPEGALQPLEPVLLALAAERAHVQPARVAEGGDEQEDPDRLAGDLDPPLAEVDLELPARRGLEAHRGARLRRQLAAQGRHRPLDRAQADADPVLGQQLLPDHVRVAPVPPEPLREPDLQPVQRLGPARRPVGRPATLGQVPAHRHVAAAELRRDPPDAPAQHSQAHHRRHLVRRPHRLPLRVLHPPGDLAIRTNHPNPPPQRVQFLLSSPVQLLTSSDNARLPGLSG
jgi:hypothetical protein